tara:strand:- start:106 stop:1017 length:912 start_codon:yes stop_codon:yes gene_type:complete
LSLENKISVILSVYNGSKYISESVRSILNQSHKNFELIIIDDGSTDNSLSLCENLKKNDERIILIKNSHKGLTRSLNDALKISKGKFIARQDSDDISLPKRLEKQLQWFMTSNKKVLCGTNCKILSDKNKLKVNWSIKYKNYDIKKKLEYSNCFVHSSVMFLRDKAEMFGFYDENLKYAQDYDLWWKLSTIGEVGNLKEKLLTIRDLKASISRQNTNKQTLDFIKSNLKFYGYKKKLVNIDDNKDLGFYEKNKFTSDKTIIMKYFYNDKLETKTYFRNLNLKQIIKLLRHPILLVRKIFKSFY